MEQELTIDKTIFSLVKKDAIQAVLQGVGLSIEKEIEDVEIEGGKTIYLNEGGRIGDIPATCSGCGTDMNLENFGHLAKGSMLIYCKNPKCFNHYIANKKIKDKDGNILN